MIQINDILSIENILKSNINYSYSQNNIDDTIILIDTLADFEQRINNYLYDNDIEEILEKISKENVDAVYLGNTDERRVVFYDQIGTTVCLAVQYIKGLIANGYNVYYIFESETSRLSRDLKEELNSMNIKYLEFNSNCGNKIGIAKKIVASIENIKPSKIFIHSPAYGALSSIILHSINDAIKYKIVPGDHHFYLGVKSIDYFIEFRDYGISVAQKFRKIHANKLIKLPYYPIVNGSTNFQGFPHEVDTKFKIIAAGAVYKFVGSNLFFIICKKILDKFENVIILFIGERTQLFDNFIKENGFEVRFIILGYRKDFSECVKNADCLLSSYPYIGGLISQYAAYYKKPILQIRNNDSCESHDNILSCLGENTFLSSIAFANIDLLLDYLKRLINSRDFLKDEGDRIHSFLFTEDKFNKKLGDILLNRTRNIVASCEFDHKRSYFINTYLKIQNDLYPVVLEPLILKLPLKHLFKFRRFYFNSSPSPKYILRLFLIRCYKEIYLKFKNK